MAKLSESGKSQLSVAGVGRMNLCVKNLQDVAITKYYQSVYIFKELNILKSAF